MITVIGSVNMDLVISTGDFPIQGQTVLGRSFQTIPGGKGANQAVAIARLGGQSAMIGCIGNDSFGEALYHNLQQEGVNVTGISTSKAATGIANIILYHQDNRIIVVPGANYELTNDVIDANWETIGESKLVILQLEIPVETITYIVEKCQLALIPVILNPAPAEHFQPAWLDGLAYLTPNEHECELIFGKRYLEVVKDFPGKVIVTLGSKGVCYHDGKQLVEVEGYQSSVVDTTGAGDTFNGALAYALCEGMDLHQAVQFANIAGSLSVEAFGAQGGMPTIQAVRERLNKMQR